MNFMKEFCQFSFLFAVNHLCQIRLLNNFSCVNEIIMWSFVAVIVSDKPIVMALIILFIYLLIIVLFSFKFKSICVSAADSDRDNVSGCSSFLMALLKAKIFLAYFSLPCGFLLLICYSF